MLTVFGTSERWFQPFGGIGKIGRDDILIKI